MAVGRKMGDPCSGLVYGEGCHVREAGRVGFIVCFIICRYIVQ